MTFTATQLRQDIYKILDQVLETGEPVEIERKGRRLKIVAEEREKAAPEGSKLSRLVRRDDVFNCDPEDLVHIDWSGEGRP